MTFAEKRAAARAKFQAEWDAARGPMCLTNDDPCNPHKHYANTERGTHCMVGPDGLCRIPHDCTCPILFACMGGCYKREVTRSAHPNRILVNSARI